VGLGIAAVMVELSFTKALRERHSMRCWLYLHEVVQPGSSGGSETFGSPCLASEWSLILAELSCGAWCEAARILSLLAVSATCRDQCC
jgi:hypothetical protein